MFSKLNLIILSGLKLIELFEGLNNKLDLIGIINNIILTTKKIAARKILSQNNKLIILYKYLDKFLYFT